MDSLPLIASSIMSKKLASGADAIVLDVKTGSGALMETLDDAIALGEAMVAIGQLAHKPVEAVVTGMEQPLGTHVGNALEIKDAIDVLSGRTGGALLEVSFLLGSRMLLLAGRAKTAEEAHALLVDALQSGRGLAKLRQLVASQGGNPACVDDVRLLPQAPVIRDVRVGQAGYITAMQTTALGLAAQNMGAGRKQKTDVIDPAVGFVLPVRLGQRVEPEDVFFTLYARDEQSADAAEAAIRSAISIGDAPVSAPPLCYALITAEGTKRF